MQNQFNPNAPPIHPASTGDTHRDTGAKFKINGHPGTFRDIFGTFHSVVDPVGDPVIDPVVDPERSRREHSRRERSRMGRRP
jgi:hypothetical protein